MNFYGSGHEFDMLEDAIEAGDMAWWLMELPSGAVFFSPNKIKMLGYDEKNTDKFVHFSSFTNLLHPADKAKAMKAMEKHLNGKKPEYEVIYRIKHTTGSYKTFYDRGRIVAKSPNGDCAVAGIVLNITDTLLHDAFRLQPRTKKHGSHKFAANKS